jgi:hypothetical protein
MNRYEKKQAERRERLEDQAQKAQSESTVVYRRARQMGDAIPFGQPILIGHHSEGRDRRYRARIGRTYEKSFDLSKKAEHYAQKAAAVGTGGISSDDPDAVKKYREQLEAAERNQATMVAANKAIRKHKTPEAQTAALLELGFKDVQIPEVLKPDFCGRIGFPDYALKNNNANIRRIKLRIADLEKLARGGPDRGRRLHLPRGHRRKPRDVSFQRQAR